MKKSSLPSRITTVLLLPAALALTACGPQGNIDRNPEISGINVDPNAMPETASLSIPMPPPKAPVNPKRAEAASLWQTGNDSFFADRRAEEVGDIVSINIQIDDQAQLRNASSRSRDGSASMGKPEFLGYGSKLDELLPGINPEDLPDGNLIDLNSSFERQGEGAISRNERINLKIAALVIQRLPNGNLVVAGRQEVKVNDEIRELRVAGIIQPSEIGMDNSIDYDRIAEARITYGGRGQLSRQLRTGYGEEAANVILPY